MIEHGIRHDRSQSLIDFACSFADKAHEGQLRKYTGEPYINHPVEVAQIVASVTDDCETICAAFLHDVIEDCGVTKKQLIDAGLGFGIAQMVVELSDVSVMSDGNRATRKAIDRAHTATASNRAKTVKLADLISNSKSIIEHGGKFADIYMEEKKLLLDVLIGGDEKLMAECNRIVDSYFCRAK